MRKLCGLIVLVISLVGASSASAAVEVGSNCIANSTYSSNYTVLQLKNAPGNPSLLAAPTGGIVTKWKVNSNYSYPPEYPEQLKVLRPTADPKKFLAVAEGSTGNIVPGQNTFETRIPVQAGDRFGVYAASGSSVLVCTGSSIVEADEMGYFFGNATVGTVNEYSPTTFYTLALSVVIEPDADGDGFGDESQDKCPRSAALQAIECPLITLGSFGLASKSSALILASASSQAQVTVSGTVNTPKTKKKKGKAKASALISIPAGTKAIGPGQVVPFTLTFPPSLKSALAAISPKQSLTLTVTTSATDLAGQPSSSVLNLKLKGTKKKAK